MTDQGATVVSIETWLIKIIFPFGPGSYPNTGSIKFLFRERWFQHILFLFFIEMLTMLTDFDDDSEVGDIVISVT